MSDKEKILNILRSSDLDFKSVFGLEKFLEVGTGTISKPLKNTGKLSIGTIKIIQERLGVNPEWWTTGVGNTFLSKDDIKKNTDSEEISILIRNLDRAGSLNEYLLKRVKELEKKLDECLKR